VSSQNWWVVAFLLSGAVMVGWPVSVARRRRATRAPAMGVRSMAARVALLRRRSAGRPRRTVILVVLAVVLAALLVAGPVAAVAGGVYAALVARVVLRRWSAKAQATVRSRTLDELGALAADLRAGLSPGLSAPGSALGTSPGDDTASASLSGTALAGSLGAPAGDPAASPADVRLLELTAAVWRLAERTGAPVADLVDRIEADARTADRARASVAAQAAGARATAMLLAGLPVGGIALGYAIGVDPLQVLLHTSLGAACVAGALLLQIGGLAWADRLASAGSAR
jgi:tight adherence protein B